MDLQHLHQSMLAGLLLLLSLTCANAVDKIGQQPSQFLQELVGRQRGDAVKGVHKLKKYLEQFGYVIYPNSTVSITSVGDHVIYPNSTVSITSVGDHVDVFDDVLESAIRTYQENYHLKVTSTLDAETVQQMMKPRCGVPDIINGTNSMSPSKKHRSRPMGSHSFFSSELIPGTPRWPPSKNHLTYSFLNSGQQLRSATARAFQRWSDVTHLTFQEVQDPNGADITIASYVGAYGDGNSFDGPGGIVAHATGPTAGRFQLDAEEHWSTNPGRWQMDLESVAVHEIGHVLGLGHSSDPNAIMYSYMSAGVTKRELQRDDINGIRALYNL